MNTSVDAAVGQLMQVWSQGFSAIDIISTLFKVAKTFDMPEYLKLDFIREIGITHMRILEGLTSIVQLCGLIARLCKLSMDPHLFQSR